MEFNVPTSAYVHIPFCRRRCFYCDFPISVVGDQRNGRNSGTIAQYIEKLCEEIDRSHDFGEPLRTVFFGGGTPSLLAVSQLEQILDKLDRRFGILSDAEISMEIDPGTFDLEQIKGFKSAGVNRFSLGTQAFQSDILKACGRTHTVEDIYTSVDLIRQAGIENFSLDLISGLPHQTIESWQESLEQAIALSPTHLSTYDLTIEPQTPFGKQLKPGEKPLPSDELTADLYRFAQRTLTNAGFEHYEISNYAKPGYQCQHNRVYWENRSFYGFGMGATSYLNGDRVSRPRKLKEYYDWIGTAQSEAEVSQTDLMLDSLMVGLRLKEGIDLAQFKTQFGEAAIAEIVKCLAPYQTSNWVEITAASIRLTDPEGFLFSNVILTTLFAAFEEDESTF
ncbi:oxygen-independent coproporphyrinogen III oxidase [Leptolyngbya boryana NIES-2135]|jgi:putative oxygen-independent coproporphyrinogen III oxidase|uniref:Heme chaperone HemW n=1 Tax=Leptolyngbya boryana NIES-2135 TaxID=1973484 RepID=A0A1Z4JC28_LEPBY|nr:MULTISPECIES: radical SAM family heme chaperone HemW [Leptolyngbya]BAY54329.1 oxygen-independent coproporphyrinogen III oxidase [Leptolyngbya boryana NIES-2135]MBD2370804.1 coproporphyrinogen III oxidase [Leptolyngbya sp. FACHB-161]MBD2377198.1 coproporphyrinogen III oxidase [Leptolyngbya sp. FACHB-238]MBD2401592.1 coproporphyrinogen III oxidase [Leptolyngbya sp. FACHB-239]MBD2408145.1 coproporphyrinogen III oxidase [Leptolyngbya sp. FACHB-402]